MIASLLAGIQDWQLGVSTQDLLLITAWLALGVASLVLLVMFVAGRGNVRHVKTSLMISIIAHCALALFSNKIPMPSAHVRNEKLEPTFEIEDLVISALDEEKQILDKLAPAWEDMAETPLPENQRQTYEDAAQELTDTQREEPSPSEPEPATLADVPDIEDGPPEIPRAENSDTQAPRTVDGTPLENYEETVESRPDVEIPTTRSGRRRIDEQGLAESEIERENRRGRTEDSTTDLRESRRMEVADATSDPSSQLDLGENSEAANRREADAADTLPAEDPGARTAKRRDEVGSGLPKSRAFSRREVVGTSPDSQSLKTDIERNPRPKSEETDLDSRLAVRRGDEQPISEDAQLRLTRNRTPTTAEDKRIARLPATYQLRDTDNRQQVAIRHGATKASEQAVENSLQWLAAHQSVEGFWDADGFMSHCPADGEKCWGAAGGKPHQGSDKDDIPHSGIQGDAGLTGLTILAFLGAGYTHEEGIYADQIDRALRWLIRKQGEDGFLGGDATHYARMYCHGMATIALGEAYGMTHDPTLQDPLQKAIDYIVARQNPKDGGWRYTVGKQGDMSMFGWQLMALKGGDGRVEFSV